QVTLTKYFYVGVFEVTQKQWNLVIGNWPSYFCNEHYRDTRPVEKVSYEDIRGSQEGAGWPRNNAVDVDSFLGRLQSKTGLIFDLPTEAQWEYACRAGTETALNSGKNLTDRHLCPNVDEIGRNIRNGGASGEDAPNCDTSGGTNKVGSYPPNLWGLYDMHGNVYEWCLDKYGGAEDYSPEPVTDPKGISSITYDYRAMRGGCWDGWAAYCRSASRTLDFAQRRSQNVGFRLVKMVP
ncbi:MAG TPA: formylglycine-generating enzyme family protein, partial [Lentisphaeria bacterium]|nr:formylglycine-generating enzyme family protein [Lentisphaeria bacterium]